MISLSKCENAVYSCILETISKRGFPMSNSELVEETGYCLKEVDKARRSLVHHGLLVSVCDTLSKFKVFGYKYILSSEPEYDAFSKEEVKVYRSAYLFLKRKQYPASMKDICYMTGMKERKVSRVLSDLESRGLIVTGRRALKSIVPKEFSFIKSANVQIEYVTR